MWHRIISFEISAKKRTRRGSVGGKRHVNATTINDNDNLNRSSNLPAVFMTNAQSVNNKMDELEVILRQEQIDICVITETWFKPDMPSSQTDINGFSMFSKSRDSRGGGVAIYVKNSIPTNELDIIVPQELECIWVQVRPYRLPRGVSAVVFCVIYILTDSPLQPLLAQHVTDTVDQLRSRYPELGFCITGDFNRMDITPITLGNHLKQLVTFPTRGRATLDLLITNIEPHYHDPSPYSNIGKSDHASVVWKPKSRLSQNTIKTRVTRPFPDDKVRAFGRWFQGQTWSEVYGPGTQNKTDAMYSILNKGMDNFFPNKTVKIHQSDKPWITPRIKSLIRKRQIAFATNSTQWPKLRNMVKRAIEKAKVMYYAEKVRKLQTSDPRKWYQSLKVMLNTNNTDMNMHIADIDESDHKAMANAINAKFVGVSSHVQPLDSSALPAFLPVKDCIPILNPWEVYHELKKVKVSKSSGPDGIPPRIIREFAYELSGPMTEILNSSFAEGIVPHQWRSAIVIPVPKQYPLVLTNYMADIIN